MNKGREICMDLFILIAIIAVISQLINIHSQNKKMVNLLENILEEITKEEETFNEDIKE